MIRVCRSSGEHAWIHRMLGMTLARRKVWTAHLLSWSPVPGRVVRRGWWCAWHWMGKVRVRGRHMTRMHRWTWNGCGGSRRAILKSIVGRGRVGIEAMLVFMRSPVVACATGAAATTAQTPTTLLATLNVWIWVLGDGSVAIQSALPNGCFLVVDWEGCRELIRRSRC